MIRYFASASWPGPCVALLLLSGISTVGAEEVSAWIGEAEGFKATSLCSNSELEIVSPPYSTENRLADEGMCGKVYVFNDSDSGDRVAFAGALLFDPVITAQKRPVARRQLIELLAKAGGGENLRLDFTDISTSVAEGFSFERIRMRSNGVEGPAGSMSWDVGIRDLGRRTVIIFNGITDLAEQQDTLSDEEKKSATELLAELSRWQAESLGRIKQTAQAP